jgi:hypothetical protein
MPPKLIDLAASILAKRSPSGWFNGQDYVVRLALLALTVFVLSRLPPQSPYENTVTLLAVGELSLLCQTFSGRRAKRSARFSDDGDRNSGPAQVLAPDPVAATGGPETGRESTEGR